MSTQELAGKVALVTGAGSGLGRSIAERLARGGAAVACCDLSEDSARETSELITSAGGRSVALAFDVTDEAATDAAVDVAADRLGGLDAVVANAGIAGEGAARGLELASWERIIAVHLTGTFLTTRAALRHLVERPGGSIVMQASAAGLVGLPNTPAYSAAKSGIIGLARQVARDYAHLGIRINAIAPGTVLTPLVQQAYDERFGADVEAGLEARAASIPLGMGRPDDIAAAAAFLVSDEARWITGTVMPVDGGLSQLRP
ncbi:SDR family NAD(P)-dependent oxidoreductase [Nocardioides hwasunensis]|uniref:SDR family oxidoreductase n=1 Tax=Nocardioides hwasunensis TaxID=397258 RepID=A0ABR8MM03_9ACTN|nr:SDR family NAD(P)-dependent oxidoreductase [Nocardioides hwasunensis]MBD3917052.1 SDR family oxidoreductase [Nocardioides hwasunensis]